MEQLFDLLIDNPFILIAVVAFLVSMLRGKKSVPGMPTFGGSPDKDTSESPEHHPQEAHGNRQSHHERHEQHDRHRRHETHEMPISAEGAPASFHSEVYTEHHARNFKLDEGDSVWDDPSTKNLHPLTDHEIGSSSESGHRISAAEARQGVIWAEILGPPRAKRPLHK